MVRIAVLGNGSMKPRSARDGSQAVVPARLFRVPEAAAALALSPRSVWRLIALGKLRTVRLGRAVRVVADSVDALISEGGEK